MRQSLVGVVTPRYHSTRLCRRQPAVYRVLRGVKWALASELAAHERAKTFCSNAVCTLRPALHATAYQAPPAAAYNWTRGRRLDRRVS